jgi:hypothetical protein
MRETHTASPSLTDALGYLAARREARESVFAKTLEARESVFAKTLEAHESVFPRTLEARESVFANYPAREHR